jgi:hypothetical protein
MNAAEMIEKRDSSRDETTEGRIGSRQTHAREIARAEGDETIAVCAMVVTVKTAGDVTRVTEVTAKTAGGGIAMKARLVGQTGEAGNRRIAVKDCLVEQTREAARRRIDKRETEMTGTHRAPASDSRTEGRGGLLTVLRARQPREERGRLSKTVSRALGSRRQMKEVRWRKTLTWKTS